MIYTVSLVYLPTVTFMTVWLTPPCPNLGTIHPISQVIKIHTTTPTCSVVKIFDAILVTTKPELQFSFTFVSDHRIRNYSYIEDILIYGFKRIAAVSELKAWVIIFYCVLLKKERKNKQTNIST